MGDPKKTRKKYQTPMHPWQKTRIEEEKILLNEYGLKNKKEIWKMESIRRDFANRAKKLISARGSQAELERSQMLAKLQSYNLIATGAGIDEVLGLTLRHVLERRLQTLVYKKSLARSENQARQFIVHGHIKVGNKSVTAPSYIVPVSEEDMISFVQSSTLSDAEHPERAIKSESQVKKEKARELKQERAREQRGRRDNRGQGRRRQENKGPKKEEKTEPSGEK